MTDLSRAWYSRSARGWVPPPPLPKPHIRPVPASKFGFLWACQRPLRYAPRDPIYMHMQDPYYEHRRAYVAYGTTPQEAYETLLRMEKQTP